MLDNLKKHNRRHGKPLSSKNLREVATRVMEEEEKCDKININNVITDN